MTDEDNDYAGNLLLYRFELRDSCAATLGIGDNERPNPGRTTGTHDP